MIDVSYDQCALDTDSCLVRAELLYYPGRCSVRRRTGVCAGLSYIHVLASGRVTFACYNMSQWEALLKLTGEFQEKIISLYSDERFPMEVRQYLAPWFESQNWKLAARDRQMATVQLQNLLEHLDTQYSRFTQADEILQKHNFRKFKLNVQHGYQETPEKLAEMIQYYLHYEQQILLEAQEVKIMNEQPVQAPMEMGKQYKIEQRVNEAKERVLSVEQEVKFLEEQQEMFQFKFKTFSTESSEHAPAPYIQKKKMELQNQLNELDKKRREVLDQVKELLGLCETLFGFLDQEIMEWLHRQKLSCIGADTDTSLKQLESWVTKTVEVFLQLKRLLCILSELSLQVSYERDPLKTDPQQLQQRLLEMLHCLVQKSFVVDKQPIMTMTNTLNRPLVLKTSSQFCVRARLLVKLPNLGHSMKVSYVMDKDLPNIKGYRRFNLLGPAVKALEDAQGEGLVVEYKHLQLKEQKAGMRGKGGKGINDVSFGVLEELHIISLITHFDYDGVQLNLEAATLPFIVISNTSQFVGAFASVLWFNLLSSDPKDVTFFSKPPDAPWSLLAEALSWQFSCCTKRGLNPDQRKMLGKKLCGMVPKEDSTVSWSKFSKENMPKVSFTFWVWFDAIVVLIKAHLENIWNDGYVMGFVSRSREDTLLKTMQQGTFLLRFSESVRDGGVTCSWVDHQPDGTYTIRSVQPYTKKELSNIPLTEIIRNYQMLAEQNIPENPLKFLYPNIPKDEAFGPYYEKTSEMTLEYQKYIKHRLIMVSERSLDDCQISITSGTPLYYPDMPDQDLSEYDPQILQNNLTDRQLFEDIHIENLLLNPNNDPFISSPSGDYHELSMESFDNL
ncbi:signal transducer and activator of transcription 1-alpha/beta-like [Pseudophryne corroboree]|uniref:signal transducer and activator of transcription 1-alpha/beta-like n=1 Tax=Pseudophryne corroboree TaxID=495146 RepID=UPI003081DDB9